MRPEKKQLKQTAREQLEGSSFVILADYKGLSVEQLADLRARMREHDGKFTVIKNTFLKLAAHDTGWDDVDGFLEGPTAMVHGSGDVTQLAKVLRQFVKEHELPSVKGGRLGERTLTAQDVSAMADIPPREVLLGRLVGTLAAPMSQVVGVLHQKLSSLLYVLKAVEEKKQASQ